ncbi:MAG TPA: hypothetical protein VM008_12585 [Phycisphaerae bacterium]|nr:hypothetical protein [Phycisphaerae bacterium]
MRRRLVVACMIVAGLGSAAIGQETQSATAPAIDLSTPQAALEAVLHAEQKIDAAGLGKLLVVTPSYRQGYVDRVVNYQMWMHYLERESIKAFGREAGLTVEGHVRSLDEQIALDEGRVKNANVEYNADKTEAALYLPIEGDRPAGLQTDRFNFVDVYRFKKMDDGWKLDFLRTYDSGDPRQNQQYSFEEQVFPQMAAAVKELAARLKKGEFRSAAEVKRALDAKWDALYAEMEKDQAGTRP